MNAGWRVAIVHDWLTGMRGGEKVLEVMCELFPQADLYTLLHVPGSVSRTIERHQPRQSFVGRLPLAGRAYRYYLPVFPAAVEQFDLEGYDLVISASHCAAKSAITSGRTRHLCYCFTPMRYAWDQFDAYFGAGRVGWQSTLMRQALRGLARWDAGTAHRPHRYLAISQYVADRIRRYYNRRSAVVHPPVDTGAFAAADDTVGDHLLVVSALVPYKRIELAIEACRLAGVQLKIVGKGPELSRLQRLAGPHVEFLGFQPDEALRHQYRRARAVLLPGEEDFGIVPVEAQASGRPVIALGRGGSRETVVDGRTGILVEDATPESFAAAIRRLDTLSFDPAAVRTHAERFSRQRFIDAFTTEVDALMSAPEDRVRW